MDPDETLKQLREALHVMDTARNLDELLTASKVAMEAMEALDKWITGGGFLPKAWQEV